jgi:hypothetical protein
MWKDPIVEEVRKHREARAAKFGFNIRAIVEDVMRRQAASGHRVVDLSKEYRPKRRLKPMRKAKGNKTRT